MAGVPLHEAVRGLAGGAGAKLGAFAALIARLRGETLGMTLPEAVEHVVERSGLITHYQTEKEGQDRIENLRELVNAAAAFLSDQGVGQDVPASAGVVAEEPILMTTPLAAFLSHASLEAGDNQALEGTDAMQLMTVHAAKGLEFDAVFITGLEEGLFPHENSAQEPSGLEEERRLMYVAITRARKRLYLSFSQTRMLHGQTRYNIRSRFLEELPESTLKWLTPRMGAQRPVWGDPWSGNALQGDRGRRAAMPDAPMLSRADMQRAQGFDRGLPWRVGQSVAHARFGEGVILGIEGSGTDARVQVNFGRQGVKWLALSVAKLDPVN
jgi:DNA helicase-2/ATP-dependent DNA helicase PcrA